MKELQGAKIRKARSISDSVYQDTFSMDEKIAYTKSLQEKQKIKAVKPEPLEVNKEKKVKE